MKAAPGSVVAYGLAHRGMDEIAAIGQKIVTRSLGFSKILGIFQIVTLSLGFSKNLGIFSIFLHVLADSRIY